MKRKTIFRNILLIFSGATLISCQISKSEMAGTPIAISSETVSLEIQGEDQIQTPAAVTEQAPQEIQGDLEIEFWHPFVGEMADLMNKLISQYNLENQWGNQIIGQVHADQNVLVSDLTDEFQKNGKVPDLIISSSQSLKAWFENGYSIRILDEFLSMISKNNSEDNIPQIFPVFWNIDLVNGKRIGIPVYQSGQFLFYNQTWAQELGFSDYPRSSEDFQEQTCLAEQTNRFDSDIKNNGTGGWIFDRNSLSLLAWMRSFNGGQLINDRSQPNLAVAENIDALQFLNDLYHADCAWTGKQSIPYIYFADRMALIYSGQMEDIGRQLQFDTINNNTDSWKLIPYPSSIGKPVVMVKGLSFAVTTDDDLRVMAALDFIRWVLQPENQIKIIEKTGVFPLSNEIIRLVDQDIPMFPIWQDSLQYLPYVQPEPVFEEWIVMEKILEDIGWQLTRFANQPENIESMLSDGEKITGEINQLDE